MHHAEPASRDSTRKISRQRIMKTGWLAATAAHSASVESGFTPSKNIPTSNFQRRR